MAVAHLIHGWIGTGKTTFAIAFENEVRGIRFNDEFYLTLYYGQAERPEVLDHELNDRLTAVLEGIWPKVLVRGVDVVLDFGFWTRSPRDRLDRSQPMPAGRRGCTPYVVLRRSASSACVDAISIPDGTGSWPSTASTHLWPKYADLDVDEAHLVIDTA